MITQLSHSTQSVAETVHDGQGASGTLQASQCATAMQQVK